MGYYKDKDGYWYVEGPTLVAFLIKQRILSFVFDGGEGINPITFFSGMKEFSPLLKNELRKAFNYFNLVILNQKRFTAEDSNALERKKVLFTRFCVVSTLYN